LNYETELAPFVRLWLEAVMNAKKCWAAMVQVVSFLAGGHCFGQEPKLRATLHGHDGYVDSVVFGPDGKLLASGSHDKTIKLWDVMTGKEQATLNGHTGSVMSVAFSPDGQLLTSGSLDRSIKLWDIPTTKKADKWANGTHHGKTARRACTSTFFQSAFYRGYPNAYNHRPIPSHQDCQSRLVTAAAEFLQQLPIGQPSTLAQKRRSAKVVDDFAQLASRHIVSLVRAKLALYLITTRKAPFDARFLAGSPGGPPANQRMLLTEPARRFSVFV
jgi:hypothetical protein